MNEDPERQAMQDFLDEQTCKSCGNKELKLSGMVNYSNPLGWHWKCNCGQHGTVGYAHIPHVVLPEDKQYLIDELMYRGEEYYSIYKVYKEHGTTYLGDIKTRYE